MNLITQFVLSGLLAATTLAAQADERQVVCISQNKVEAACTGALKVLRHEQFFKRWPADHAIAITTQTTKPTSAPIMVTTGTLHVVRVVRQDKLYGTKPVYVIQMWNETTNLADGGLEDLAAQNMGWTLANRLNKLISSGETDDRP
jgi:hypothetical protein